MIMADTGSIPNVSGINRAVPATGPKPGNMPTNIPIETPIRQYNRFHQVMALSKPPNR
jgi:hypothetical protein